MALYEFVPSKPLVEYVRAYRIVRFQFASNASLPIKVYPPRPEHCLSFYPKDYEKVDFAVNGQKAGNLAAVLFGQHTEVSHRQVGADFLLLQIVFKPGALYRITGIPSTEFTNAYLDAALLFKDEIKWVNEQLNHCQSHPQMVAVAEKFLLGQIQKKALEQHRLDLVSMLPIKNSDPYSVDALAKASCMSVRQFERIFKERMGVSPKFFIKVARFENAYRMKNQSPQLDWLSIAYDCGYYDYQHLVKDCKALTQHTPNDFHQLDLGAPERAFGVADTY